MDQYNCIDQAATLTDLENDMFEWSRLPLKFRHMSDDESIRKRGIDNRKFYLQKKSEFMEKEHIEESVNEISASSMSEELQKSPYIVIIDPSDSEDIVKDKYNKYILLPMKYRRWSDYYSYDIYGYTLLDKFNSTFNRDPEYHTDVYVNKAMCENNIIDMLIYKSLNYVSLDESYRDRWVDDSFLEDTMDFDTLFNNVTPYFTPEEYNRLSENQLVEELEYPDWKKSLHKAIASKDTQKIIDLGWNPEVPFTESNIEYARNRQIAWFKNHSPRVIDVTNIENQLIFKEEPIEETSKFMEDLYAEKNLYPIFIVMSYSNTMFGNVERRLKHVKYTHSGLCFNSDLSEIFTFSFGKNFNGFTTDSLQTYLNNSPKAIMSIICIFVDKQTRDSIYSSINYLQDNKLKTRYGFGNIVNILMNRAKNFPYPENLAMVCSQFVDMMLKLVDIDLTNKSSNLVIPQDFWNIRKPEVYKVYEGLCANYNEAKLERIIKLLFYKNNVVNIKYSDKLPEPVSFINNSLKEGYEGIISEINDMLNPTCVIESNAAFVFDSEGNLSVDTCRYIKDQYDESHKLLSSYDEENLEGLKREVAHMFYLNTMIEDIIRNKKKADEDYGILVELRSLIIQDFKEYMKLIMSYDKEFDFIEYYKNSEYNIKTKAIDDIRYIYDGSAIKSTLKSIERFKK